MCFRGCRLKWSDLFEPVINLCRTGFNLSQSTGTQHVHIVQNANNCVCVCSECHKRVGI